MPRQPFVVERAIAAGRRLLGLGRSTLAQVVADRDLRAERRRTGRRFSEGARPVIRWIKGDGLDDDVTRAAISQATRIFGARVDYCLCTHGIDASRARRVLEWAAQPVEWWSIGTGDNAELADHLLKAGCSPERFGYWWKWFPERVRPDGPEWILDGDMVITGAPRWFDAWAAGKDRLRVSQDNKEGPHIYGTYSEMVDPALALYSGLISLPPRLRYMGRMSRVLSRQPLRVGHDGIDDMCEQGVVAAAFQSLGAHPIPLYEFPFGRAFEDALDYGLEGDRGCAWGYHFGASFRRANPHFERLVADGTVFSTQGGDLIDRFRWLGGEGPWGIPGWAMPEPMARTIMSHTAGFAGRDVLELGTSRGRMSAIMASQGCRVTTVDHVDRGAYANLLGLSVVVVVDDAVRYLSGAPRQFDLIVCDLHGNSPTEWARLGPPLLGALKSGGTLLASNATLPDIAQWREETGVGSFLQSLPRDWPVEIDRRAVPGLAIVRKP